MPHQPPLQAWDAGTLEFLDRILDRSGLSPDGTYLPHAIHPKFVVAEGRTPRTDLASAAVEAKTVGAGSWARGRAGTPAGLVFAPPAVDQV